MIDNPNSVIDSSSSTIATIWGDIASATTQAVTKVENVGSEVWSGAKSVVAAPIHYAEDAANSVQNKVLVIGGISIVVILVAVWVLGKSGLVGQAAGFGRP